MGERSESGIIHGLVESGSSSCNMESVTISRFGFPQSPEDFSKLPTSVTIGAPAGVGDVNSDAVGSGARYNGGKSPVHLLTIGFITSVFERYVLVHDDDDLDTCQRAYLIDVLDRLSCIQYGNGALSIGACAAEAFIRLSDDIGDVHDLISQTAAVFDYGRKKYAEWNWLKGMNWSVPLACATRHVLAMLGGEINDPESGLTHAGHVGCNLVMLYEYANFYPQGNDLPHAIIRNLEAESSAGRVF